MQGLTPISHAHDPATSRIGESVVTRSGTRASHSQAIYDWLLVHTGGHRYDEVAAGVGLSDQQTEKRLSDLKNNGLAYQRGRSLLNGNWRGLWHAVDAGVQATLFDPLGHDQHQKDGPKGLARADNQRKGTRTRARRQLR